MRFVCSHCHTPFEPDPEGHTACPNCKAEAGLEPVKDGTPPAMRYFGLVLLVLAIVVLGGAMAGIMS